MSSDIKSTDTCNIIPFEYGDHIELPVIDLSQISAVQIEQSGHDDDQLEGVCSKIRAACEDLGFFYVINHGIDTNLMETVDSVVGDLFTLPTQVKEKAVASGINVAGYFPGQINGGSKLERLPERMSLLTSRTFLQETSHKLWPQGHPTFCQAIEDYILQLQELAKTIIKLIVCSLGLEVSKYYASTFEKFNHNLLLNHYIPLDNIDDKDIVSYRAHTDSNCLTILHQGYAGGLQIRTKEGKWINVRPLRDSFVINLGDTFKMWSNGRYRSAEHRVVYGGQKSRLSVAFFLNFPNEIQIDAPRELVEAAHPRKYKAFFYEEFIKHVISRSENTFGSPTDFFLL
eukprot:Gb_34780 [translate_table: standard]